MNKEECYYLGYVSKTRGLKGDLTVTLDVDSPADYLQLDSFYLDIDDNLVPFFVESSQLSNKHLSVRLEGINSLEEAEPLVKKGAYLPLSSLPELSGTDFYFHEVIGFEVIDVTQGHLGSIVKIIDNPGNPLIQVFKNEKEILIPISDDVIQEVDRESKSLVVASPEGLIDLYLGA